MPKNKVSDPITDQEMAFARLVLSGGTTDRQAAEAVGLNPDSAAYIKSKPNVRAYMLEHRAAVEQQLVQQEAEGLRRLSLDRERVLDRLWEIAHLSPEVTRGSITGQVKALSMIVAIQNLIPDRRLVSEKKSLTAPPVPACRGTQAQIYKSAWLREQHGESQPPHAPVQEEVAPDLSSRLSRPAVEPERPVPACRGSVVEGPAVPLPDPGESNFPGPLNPSQTPSSPRPHMSFVPDARLAFSTKKNPFNPFGRRR